MKLNPTREDQTMREMQFLRWAGCKWRELIVQLVNTQLKACELCVQRSRIGQVYDSDQGE